uniref:Uncharacterized protein n=1 Tax=viral metagenome TaxID=1070528 RepID=A0A6C0JXN1_9ZZZZ
MKRPVRNANGKYVIAGVTYSELFGSRAQVHNGTAYKTSGGLTKKDLVMNKWGRIVSEKKHKTAKKEKRLQKYGYYTKKGKFGAVKRSVSRKNKSKKGGADGVSESTLANATLNGNNPTVVNPTSPHMIDTGK